MKYKVGDKVRIVSEKSGRCWNKVGLMDKWLGKVMTVRRVLEDNYSMVEDEEEGYLHSWTWYEHMIAGLAKPVEYPQIHITTDGKTTTAVKTLNGKVVDKVAAKLHPDDEFDFDKGAKIALDRLLTPSKVDYPCLRTVDWLLPFDGCRVGEETGMTALFGEELCVGDVVEVYNTLTKSTHKRFVVLNLGQYCILNPLAKNIRNGISSHLQIRKVKSCKYLLNGETYDGVKFYEQKER